MIAIRGAGVSGWSESTVVGHGRAAAGREVEHVRLEIVVSSDSSQPLVRAIAKAADTGGPGEGLIVELPVASVTRLGRAEDPLERRVRLAQKRHADVTYSEADGSAEQ